MKGLIIVVALVLGSTYKGYTQEQDTLPSEGVPETIENLGSTDRDLDAFVRGEEAFESIEDEAKEAGQEENNNPAIREEDETE